MIINLTFLLLVLSMEYFASIVSMHSLGMTDINIQDSYLLEMTKSMNFGHLHRSLSALKLREKSFQVVERDNWESTSFNKGAKPLIFRSKSEYNFFDDDRVHYINLDDVIKSPDMMIDLTETALSHCSHSNNELNMIENILSNSKKEFTVENDKKVFLIGSNRGEWFKSNSTSRLFSILKKNNPSKEHNSIIRVVKAIHRDIADINNRCVKFETEDVHYLKLFEKVNIESFVDNPYQNSFKQLIKSKTELATSIDKLKRFRKLGTIVTPDDPVITCEDKYWGDASQYSINSGGPQSNSSTTYNFLLGSQGCVSYETDLPGSFNANYDFAKDHAATDPLVIPGVTGVQCSNCYAFLGAGILAILEYNTGTYVSGSFFRVEIKIAGGAGFNVDLNIQNPEVSSSKTVPEVIPPETEYHTFPIGKTGLSLNYKFGGVDITLSGSGQATGSLSAGAGSSIAASAAVLFDGANLTFPYKASVKVIPPFFKATTFNAGNSFDVALGLTGTELFQLIYGTSLASVSVDFSVQATGTTELSFTTSISKTASSANNANRNNIYDGNSVELSAPMNQKSFVPGEYMTINFYYDDLPVNELTTLFYSLITSDGSEYLLMDKSFSASEQGHGVFKSKWNIPWDSRFQSNGVDAFYISVRSSSHILYTFQSNAFYLSMFSHLDTIFQEGPIDGQSINLDTPIHLKWNPLSLNYFIKDVHSPYSGKEEVAYLIVFNIFAEHLNENGTTSSQAIMNFTKTNIINNGSCDITFPSYLSSLGEKFYITINSIKYSNIWSWSSGYFYLNSLDKNIANYQVQYFKVNEMFGNSRLLKNKFSNRLLSQRRARNLQATCINGNQVTLTNSATTGGGINGASVSLSVAKLSLPISSSQSVANLQDPTVNCLSTKGSGSGSGSGSGNTGGTSNSNRVITGAILSTIVAVISLVL